MDVRYSLESSISGHNNIHSESEKRKSSVWTTKTSEVLLRRNFAKAATIVPTEDKFQKLKNVKLAGFSFVARTTNWYARIFWIILILIAFAFCLYEVYRTIYDFINNPVITTYILKPMESIELPSFFICLSTTISARFVQSDRPGADAVLNAMQAMSGVTNDSDVVYDANDEYFSLNGRRLSGKALERNFMAMGFDVDQVFLSCRFYANSSEWKPVKCSTIVTPMIDHRFGKCFRLRADQNQTFEGKALSLVLNSRSTSDAVNESLIAKPYQGAYITIDSSYQPLSNDRYLVSAQSYTKIALKLTAYELLNMPSGAIVQPCLEDTTDSLKILNTSYSISSCRFECTLAEIVRVCKCLPVLDRSIVKGGLLNSTAFCGFDDYKLCIEANVSVSDLSKFAVKECKARCLPYCKYERFEASSSSAPLNPPAFKNYLSDAHVDELIWLEIAYNRLEKAIFTQSSSMTFDFFVGNMGSQVTLWLGGSMLTLLPLPFSLFAFCCMAGIMRANKVYKNRKENS